MNTVLLILIAALTLAGAAASRREHCRHGRGPSRSRKIEQGQEDPWSKPSRKIGAGHGADATVIANARKPRRREIEFQKQSLFGDRP